MLIDVGDMADGWWLMADGWLMCGWVMGDGEWAMTCDVRLEHDNKMVML